MKYSLVKEIYNLYPEFEKDNNLANLTHYFQNHENGVAWIFKESAIKYIKSKDNSFNFQSILPLEWDVPFPPPTKPKFKFIDLFAGIGGFRIAMQNQGGKCVFSSEIDTAAKKTYELNYGEVPFGDITLFTNENISDEQLDRLIPDHHVLCAGFPCQPFSRAGVSARNFLGKSHGFDDENQGNLFFDIIRIAKVKKPMVLFLENVKNLKSHDGGKTFKIIEELIKAAGYTFSSEIINSKTEVPQSRERTYMVCIRENGVDFTFPKFIGEPKLLSSILELEVDKEYTISDKLWLGHQNRSVRNKARGTGFTVKLADLNKPSNTIVARYYKDGKECLIPQGEGNPRKITPRECARLQGYPENFILHPSKNACYKQFGNSVSLPVICKIAKQIISTLEENGIL